MRILFVIDSLGRGGAETFLLNLTKQLRSERIDCHVAYLAKPGDLVEEFRNSGTSVHLLGPFNHPAGCLYRLHSLWSEHRYELIHAHLMYASLASNIYSMLNRRFRLVTTFHSLEYDNRSPQTIMKRFKLRLLRLLFIASRSHYSAVSNAVRESVIRTFGLCRIRVTPIGVPEEITDSGSACQSKNLFRVVVPARLKAVKGHCDIIEAVALLKRNNAMLSSVLRVEFVGDGALRGKLEAQIESLGVDDCFQLVGELENSNTLRHMASCNMVLLASYAEGLPVSIVESMLLGVPVAATSVGGVPELIRDGITGLLFKPNDPQALAETLITAMENADMLASIALNAKAFARMELTIKSVAPSWLELYR